MKLYANGQQVQGRTLGSRSAPQTQISGQQMPAYQPQPQSYSTSQTSYAMSPAPVLDPYGEQRYQGMYAAAQKADPYAADRRGYLDQLKQMSAPGYQFAPTDPSYAFRMKQGQGALESSLAAQGLLGSGRAGLELQEYGQQAASQEFQAQFARLQAMAGMGDPAAAARLEQEAVEGRYRTYQPQMMEIGRTSTDYGFPGGMSGGMSGGGGSRSLGGGGGGRSEYAAVLANMATGGSGMNVTADRYGSLQRTLSAARAKDIARGLPDPAPSGVWGSGVLEKGAKLATAQGSGGSIDRAYSGGWASFKAPPPSKEAEQQLK